MHIIKASFENELAYAKLSELLALGHSPERLAERLGLSRDLDMVTQGVAAVSFTHVVDEIKRLQAFMDIERQIADLQAGKSKLRFLGAGFQERQIARLQDERRKFGSLLEVPRWFYKQPRVRLLACIRDYALDGSIQEDAQWIEVEEGKIPFPIVQMFETADLNFAQTLVAQLEKPLKDVDLRFLLQNFEGNRSIHFDLEEGTATYYAPAPGVVPVEREEPI
jgi:hypothetical protein